MKTVRSRNLILIGLLAVIGVGGFAFWILSRNPNGSRPLPPKSSPSDITPPQTNRSLVPKGFALRAADMTAGEKAELAGKFQAKFKPAAAKWLKAYAGHVPFRIEDLTLKKFHSRLGNHLYTFMINPDTTLTIQDSSEGAKVAYLMSRKAAVDMNQLPQRGFVPDFTIPIQRSDVIQMVAADSGVEFKPNEVLIKPTAAACALNGGAFVDILPTGADPNNGLSYKISMVFNSNGILVNYERDPFF